MANGYWIALVNVKNKKEYQKALNFLNDNNSERIIQIVDGLD